MASSPPTATLATSGEVWRRPSNCRRGTGGTGSGSNALSGSPPMRSSPSLPTWLPCNEDPRYWTKANNGDRNWRFGGKLHISLPGRRSRSLFPADRATHGSESGRPGLGNQSHVTSSRGILGFPFHSSIGRWRRDDRDSSVRVERIASLREPQDMHRPECAD